MSIDMLMSNQGNVDNELQIKLLLTSNLVRYLHNIHMQNTCYYLLVIVLWKMKNSKFCFRVNFQIKF